MPDGQLRLKSQVSWLAAGRVGAAVVSAAWFVVLARTLSLDEFGSLALLLSLGLMMSIVTDLGLTGLLAQAVALRPASARPGTRVVLRQRLVLATIASLLTTVAYAVAGGGGVWAVPALFAVSTFASTVYSTYTSVFRATGHAGYEGANESVSRLVVLALGCVVVLLADGGLLAVVGVYAAVDVLSALVLGVVFLKTTRPSDDLGGANLGLREARSLAAAGVVSGVYFRIDSWLLALIKGNGTVGRYAAAYRCFDALLLPALAVTALSIPHTAGLAGRELRDRLTSLAAFSVAITAPFSVAVFVTAEPMMTLVFGARYASAAPALRILALGALVTAATSAILPPLALRSSRVAWALSISLTVNVLANLAVIPQFGATGAAATTVMCELGLLTWLVMEIRGLRSSRVIERV